MKKAAEKDKDLVLDIIGSAFYDNKSVNYVIKQGDKKNNIKRIRNLVDYSYKICFNHGEIWLDKGSQGCLMLLDPKEKKNTLSSIIWDAMLAFNCIGLTRIGKVLGREAKIKKNHPKSSFIYLWFIGVAPEHQAKGIGSKMISFAIEKAKDSGLPIYLETSVLKNLEWYKNFGFEIYNEIDFIDHTLYFLRLN